MREFDDRSVKDIEWLMEGDELMEIVIEGVWVERRYQKGEMWDDLRKCRWMMICMRVEDWHWDEESLNNQVFQANVVEE